MQELEIREGSRVLEMSVGTGWNLRFLPTTVTYFGLDISIGMLRRCQRNLVQWGRDAFLVQGAAEHLPFVDGAFDAVLHLGGVNFFRNQAAALKEMVRVAKPGTKVVVVDETQKLTRRYSKTPLAGNFYADGEASAVAPVQFLPPDVRGVSFRPIAKGDLYCLTLGTPN